MSDAFQGELRFLGIDNSPACAGAPEGNGCAERFIRTLKENLRWVRTSDNRGTTPRFDRVPRNLQRDPAIERHGFLSPTAFRQAQFQPTALAT
jgi:putative transposase